MKLQLLVLTLVTTAPMVPLHGALVASYSSGVTASAGVTGAADPTMQGWTYSGATGNNYAYGADSTIGGWRIVDGTTAASAFYSQSITPTQLADMNTNGWVASFTVAISQDAVSAAGGGVENYYGGSNSGRQTDNAFWIESASGATDYAYILYFKTNSNGDYIVSDTVSNFTIASTNQISSELNGQSASYVTLTLTYTPGGGAVLTSSLGGNFGTISTHNTYTPSSDRIVWGATSGSGQGGTVWNGISVTTVPEPTAALLGSLGLFRLLRRRR